MTKNESYDNQKNWLNSWWIIVSLDAYLVFTDVHQQQAKYWNDYLFGQLLVYIRCCFSTNFLILMAIFKITCGILVYTPIFKCFLMPLLPLYAFRSPISK